MTEKVDGCCHGCEKAMSPTGYAYAWHHINKELLLPRLQHLNETWSHLLKVGKAAQRSGSPTYIFLFFRLNRAALKRLP
ncbi:MAG: hypothetical protein V7L01_03895 [Nostoc sp.]|uniref:hypothetical protein n=1 Tax=Nostoc sp. TaxID=1180 RepID=UPI002FFD475B